jgi:hypothetical protein
MREADKIAKKYGDDYDGATAKLISHTVFIIAQRQPVDAQAGPYMKIVAPILGEDPNAKWF